ncbi:MAG: DegT/DnrJ/EryC1/StrS family aminotransferase [Candidatus Margulisbacteria bacterium]|nr:DegT/DnrJ/EryC1/StrS family aminotransferase [Candidatus Margulisiibacteriota bacterium]
MPVPFFDITRQNHSVQSEINAAVQAVISSGRYILGPNVAELEKEFAAYIGTKYAVAVASGTDALHLALRACGIKEGDEVLLPPFTFVATAEAIAYCGATPIFVDIQPDTFNLDPSKLAMKLTKKTKAILPVHLFGLPAAMDEIMQFANQHGLKAIEDCAQSTGATLNGRQTGAFGDAGCFSFFPTKNLGCFGDGGMITTNDEKMAEEVRVLRMHGSRKTYYHDIIGYNSRLDELQAAILRVKLPLLDSYSKARRKNASFYCSALNNIKGLALPVEPSNTKHTYNQFTVRVKNRDGLKDSLSQKGIPSMIYYPLSLHQQKPFLSSGQSFAESESAQKEVLSLPIFPELTPEEIAFVSSAIKEFCAK